MPLPFPTIWAENSPNLREPTASELDQGFECGVVGLRELHNRLFQDIQQAINANYLLNGSADIPVAGYQSAPPGSPGANRVRYVAKAPATGVWAGHDNEIALWDGTAWSFVTPDVGQIVNYKSGTDLLLLWWDGSAWNSMSFGGRLLNVQVFGSSGTYTPTAGTKSIIVEGVGAGGAGGGAPATGVGEYAAGGGGSPGGYALARYTSGFTPSVAVTIGAGGVGGTGIGGDGGTTSFGALLTLEAGKGGASDKSSTSMRVQYGPAGGGATGSGILFSFGAAVAPSGGLILVGEGLAVAGNGGASMMGSGGGYLPNRHGVGRGSGGAGAYAGPSSAAVVAGDGRPGFIKIYEFS